MQAKYEVKLDKFSGPLEKLLELIEEKQLEITLVNLAQVTGDFLEYLKNLDEDSKHPSILADFVVIASRLLLIKSKATSDVQISETKTGNGDGIEDLVVEFVYASDDQNKTVYFARIPVKNRVEIWQDGSSVIPEDLLKRITKELPNFSPKDYPREEVHLEVSPLHRFQ